MVFERFYCQRVLTEIGLTAWIAFALLTMHATASETPNDPILTDRSAHFLLHTDLPRQEATKLLERMEQTIDEARDYWRRPAQGMIECYVVDHLKNWPDDALPHPMARLVVDRIGGVTLIDDIGAGIHSRKKVIIFSSARRGVAEHEVVHAYCGVVFGQTGPAWYREGMAQMFTYAHGEEAGLHCPDNLLSDLTGDHPKAICEVVKGSAFTQRLANKLKKKMDHRQNLVGLVPISNWSESDIRELDFLKREYAWSWLACHLLYHNPNYRSRFKALGHCYLAHRENAFSTLFVGSTMAQLSFEYDFTVRHFEPGYRVDLCHWDWDKRFRTVANGRSVRIRVAAARGYQASGLQVTGGDNYLIKTTGAWKMGAAQQATNAAGDSLGRGHLEGVVLKDYQLSEPFNVGGDTSFQAPCDGQLFLRCYDQWAELSDNEGSVVVTLGRAKRR